MLGKARRKTDEARARVRFDHGLAQELPYQGASFDRVVSSLLFHHLNRGQKADAAQEVFRILRPGGQFHIAGPLHTTCGLDRPFSRSALALYWNLSVSRAISPIAECPDPSVAQIDKRL